MRYDKRKRISAGIQVMCGKTMCVGDKTVTNRCFTVSAVIPRTAPR
ncbi:hypothetical protein [Ruminococcus albus]|uniref:Uncharacterized protein n=1 Tax=Ruminococcus albus 8 TaxID=246199 RepID=E9S9G4_RUMAL|nr:hypothetical protein [Ruminococcus albus]EGC04073.1 hypothetical protein CUS_6277 [Ruminococcus albus 8]